MSVGAWDPANQITRLDASLLGELTEAAKRQDADSFGLSAAAIGRLAATVRLPPKAWQAAERLADADLIALVRFYTLAERRFPDWKAGAKSPVIALHRILRRRDAWPADLTAWIKAHSDNRFLPHGSLIDRL